MTPRHRYFTPAEADALVPAVAARVRGIADIVRRARNVAEVNAGAGVDPDAVTPQLDAIREEIEKKIADLSALGVDVKGLEPGLVDFPALMNGREVYLCWREGEDRITYWHPIHTGVAGRVAIHAGQIGAFEWEN